MSEKEKRTRPLKDFGGKECSEEFAIAFISGSSIAADCTACGRTHFFDNSKEGWDEGEYEDLVRKNQKDPDRYQAHSDNVICYGYLFGKQVVYNCPCGFAAWVEESIWRNRNWISKYLVARAQLEAEKAQSDIVLTDGLKTI